MLNWLRRHATLVVGLGAIGTVVGIGLSAALELTWTAALIAARQMFGLTALGFLLAATLSKTGAELLFDVFSQRHERSAILLTSNLPFDEWTDVFGSQRLTGALLDRLTHHAHVLTCNGDSYRLADAKRRRGKAAPASDPTPAKT